MNPRQPSQQEFDEVELTAAEWFSRKEFGLSPQESEDFVVWLNSDPRHARVYAQLDQTSRTLDRWPESLAVSSSGPASAAKAGSSVRGLRWNWATGLAASVALVGTAFWFSHSSSKPPYLASAVTAVGGLRTLDLPDGSSVRLNTDSAVYVRYAANERRVHLTRGEALFTVAKNPARPFYVEAGGVSVRAVGTAFNIRLRPDSVEVLVTEGRVRVEDSSKGETLLATPSASAPGVPPVLEAGQEVIVAIHPAVAATTIATVHAVPLSEMEQTLAWRQRRLKFGSVPLSEVVAEFNRYNTHKLVIEDPELASQLFGGTFRADGYETLLSLLEQNFDVVLDRQADVTILHRRSH